MTTELLGTLSGCFHAYSLAYLGLMRLRSKHASMVNHYSNIQHFIRWNSHSVPELKPHLQLAVVWWRSICHWAPVTMERHPSLVRFQKIPGCYREGWQGKAASSCPYGKHGRRLKSGPGRTDERYQPSWQMQGMTRSKKRKQSYKHFHIYTINHTDVSLQSRGGGEISIWHERQRKEANICSSEMEIKSFLLACILVPPSSVLPLPPSGS